MTAVERIAQSQYDDATRRARGDDTLLTLAECRAELLTALDEAEADPGTPDSIQRAMEPVRAGLRVEFNRRFTRRMGDANPRKNLIRLSAPLWPRAGYAKRRDTLRHELAHLVTRAIDPRSQSHGCLWHMVARRLGCTAIRCHSVPREDLARKPTRGSAVASCRCRNDIPLGPVRARRLRAGTRYACRRCGTRLTIAD